MYFIIGETPSTSSISARIEHLAYFTTPSLIIMLLLLSIDMYSVNLIDAWLFRYSGLYKYRACESYFCILPSTISAISSYSMPPFI